MPITYLTDSAQIVIDLDLSTTVADKCEKRLPLAKLTLVNWKGQPWYDAMIALATSDPTDEDFLRAREAESMVCYWFALPHLNVILEDSGGILAVTWEESAGIKTEKRTASPQRIEYLRAEVLSAARTLVMADVVCEYSDEEGQTGILTVEGVGPATTTVFSAFLNENEV